MTKFAGGDWNYKLLAETVAEGLGSSPLQKSVGVQRGVGTWCCKLIAEVVVEVLEAVAAERS